VEWFKRFFGEEYLKFDCHEDTCGEVGFVEQALALRQGERVLDLCCGYGRHAVELAKRGYRVFGYDLSAVLLSNACQAAGSEKVRVSWCRGDMRQLPYQAGFDAVISMFTSVGYFEDEADNFRVLQNIGDVLSPGGRFLIDTVNRDFVVRHFRPLGWHRSSGVLVLERRRFDAVRSRSNVDVTAIDKKGETPLFHSVRLYGFTELEMLLASAGLETQAVFGGFEGEEYTWDSERMIVVGEKPR